MSEILSREEIKQQMRNGSVLDPMTPGLKEAARELMRPIIESIEHREIIYECRNAWLMRVDYLEVDDDGFRAVGPWLQEIENPMQAAMTSRRIRLQAEAARERGTSMEPVDDEPPPHVSEPFDFRWEWRFMRMSGSAIGLTMLCDCFYPDPAKVAAVKAALARRDRPLEAWAILHQRASSA